MPAPARLAAFVGLATVVWLRHFGLSVALPQRARQIPREVFDAPPHIAAWRFGVELGLGFRTYVTSDAAYLLAGAVVLLWPDPALAAAAGVGFGVGRGLMPTARAFSQAPERWDERLSVALPLVKVVATLATSVVAWAGHVITTR